MSPKSLIIGLKISMMRTLTNLDKPIARISAYFPTEYSRHLQKLTDLGQQQQLMLHCFLLCRQKHHILGRTFPLLILTQTEHSPCNGLSQCIFRNAINFDEKTIAMITPLSPRLHNLSFVMKVLRQHHQGSMNRL